MIELDKPEEFEKLSINEKEIVIKWIKDNIKPRKTVNNHYSSYGLKHYFEADKNNNGFYMTNGAFKGAMLKCGYKPLYEDDTNWIYRVSNKSPAFKKLLK